MLKQNLTNKAGYLDGIRGLAAFGVFLNHYSLMFYCSWFTRQPERSHLNGFELDYARSIFSFINNGGFCVAIFFVLSGFVLSRKYFHTGDVNTAISGLHRRFLRLYIPIAFILILSYMLKVNNLYFNEATAQITGSDWALRLWHFLKPENRLWASLTYGTMFYGDASYDTCLWTISYEFYGSLFVYAFLIFTHYTSRFRLPMMLLAMYYFYVMNSPYYMEFVLGMTLCYTEQWIERKRSARTIVYSVLLLATGLMLGSMPFSGPFPDSWQENLKDIVWDYTPWCLDVAAYFTVLAFVLSPLFQKIVSIRPFLFLGFISFSLYLLHPILLGSFGDWLFLRLYNTYGYNISALIVLLATIPVLLSLSWAMARFVDQPGIRLAHKVYDYFKRPLAQPTTGTATAPVRASQTTPSKRKLVK